MFDGAQAGAILAGAAALNAATEIVRDSGVESTEPALETVGVSLTSPRLSDIIERGTDFVIEWSGRDAETTLQIWSYGPNGWNIIADAVSAAEGSFSWDTSDKPHGWYCFAAWVEDGDGNWASTVSPDWVHVMNLTNQPPTFEFEGLDTSVESAWAESFDIEWTASDPNGDATNIWLWAYSADTDWHLIASDLDGSTGSFSWDTSEDWITPGWYCFGAWAGDGSEWIPVASPDFVHLVEDPAPSVVEGNLTGGVLEITGTNEADTIEVSVSGGEILVTAADYSQSFGGTIDSIIIFANGGNDEIRITNDVQQDVSIYGGIGDDNIYAAGMGADELFGDLGDDLLIAVGGGSDSLNGGDGFDSFWCDGADSVSGAEAGERDNNTVHVIDSFFAAWTNDPNDDQYVSLEIAGQDLADPLTTRDSYVYKDFSNYELFVGSPDLEDINQGAVGNCYYLAALGGLALSDPEIINQMVTDLGDGTYAVRFFDAGQEVYVRVDGQLPAYSESSNYLVYAKQGPDGEIWMPIVEKAYAHFRYGENTYDSLSGGWMKTVNSQITGETSLTYYAPSFSSNPENLWALLATQIDADHAITLASWTTTDNPVVGNHAYVVHSVTSNEEGLFVNVFNPWGFDGRSWDDNYQDGMLTLSIEQVIDNYSYAVIAQA